MVLLGRDLGGGMSTEREHSLRSIQLANSNHWHKIMELQRLATTKLYSRKGRLSSPPAIRTEGHTIEIDKSPSGIDPRGRDSFTDLLYNFQYAITRRGYVRGLLYRCFRGGYCQIYLLSLGLWWPIVKHQGYDAWTSRNREWNAEPSDLSSPLAKSRYLTKGGTVDCHRVFLTLAALSYAETLEKPNSNF